MSGNGTSKSQAIRAKLSHPVIDSDGHWREYGPLAMDYLREEAGPKIVEKWNSRVRHFGESSFAKLVHMSASAFYQHFKAVTSMSPVQYQSSV